MTGRKTSQVHQIIYNSNYRERGIQLYTDKAYVKVHLNKIKQNRIECNRIE